MKIFEYIVGKGKNQELVLIACKSEEDLKDCPYKFTERTDLVYVGGPFKEGENSRILNILNINECRKKWGERVPLD